MSASAMSPYRFPEPASKPAPEFTDAEMVIIRSWLSGSDMNGSPEVGDSVDLDAALIERGFEAPAPWPYTRHRAAVGTILMEPVRDRQGHRGRPYELPGHACDDQLLRRAARSGLVRSGGVSALFSVLWERPRGTERVRHDYAAVWVPAFGRMFVTESLALPSDLPYADYAIGHWDPDASEGRAFERIIKGHWRRQPEWMDGGWEMYMMPGLVPEDDAFEWAEAVWGVEGMQLPPRGVLQ